VLKDGIRRLPARILGRVKTPTPGPSTFCSFLHLPTAQAVGVLQTGPKTRTRSVHTMSSHTSWRCVGSLTYRGQDSSQSRGQLRACMTTSPTSSLLPSRSRTFLVVAYPFAYALSTPYIPVQHEPSQRTQRVARSQPNTVQTSIRA
jgi:hypothetical protein